MKELLTIKNLTITKDNKNLLRDISLSFFDGVNTFICGTSGSGKTSLLESIAESQNFKENIQCKCNIAVVFDKSFFNTSFVEDEIRYLYLNEDQKQFLFNFFDKNILKTNPNQLSFYQKKLLNLCSFLYKNPKIVFIDNIYSFLNKEDIEKFNTYFKENKITVVLVSTNIEDALNYEYMIIMNEGIVAIEGKTEQVLQEEKLLKRLGIGLPFYVDLSIQLKYYNLIQNIYLKKEELVDALWK